MSYLLKVCFRVEETETYPNAEAAHALGNKLASEVVPPEGSDIWYQGSEVELLGPPKAK